MLRPIHVVVVASTKPNNLHRGLSLAPPTFDLSTAAVQLSLNLASPFPPPAIDLSLLPCAGTYPSSLQPNADSWNPAPGNLETPISSPNIVPRKLFGASQQVEITIAGNILCGKEVLLCTCRSHHTCVTDIFRRSCRFLRLTRRRRRTLLLLPLRHVYMWITTSSACRRRLSP